MIDVSTVLTPAVRRWLTAGAILLAAMVIYWPALPGTWLWDDDVDILKNPLLRDADGLWRIWFSRDAFDYYPIKSSVQWLQWQLWGARVAGYHATNVILHAVGALLLWRVFARLGLARAGLGALAFAVHPLAVESVAWMAELKNALSLPPLLLALLAWLDFAERGRRGDYGRALAWFLTALLCKTSVVMFPVFLVVLTWWQRPRLAVRDLLPLAPFFALSLVLGCVTLWFQAYRGLGGEAFSVGNLWARCALSGTTLAFYAAKALWPANLMPIYPQWTITPLSFGLLSPWLAVAGGAAWAWHRRSTWGRHALLGGSWFILHLLPFAGFFTISYLRFTWVMDHFAYVALPGLIGLILALVPRHFRENAAIAVGAVICVLLGLQSRQLAATYRDARTFWTHAVQKNHGAAVARNNLGLALAASDPPAALREYEEALRLQPGYFEARVNLGNALLQKGQPAEAISHLQQAAAQRPQSAAVHYNLGLAQQAAGHLEAAQASFDQGVRLQPNHADALDARGELRRRTGRLDEARLDFEAALRADPNLADAHHHLALLHGAAGRAPDALHHFAAAARLRPASAEAANNYGTALVSANRIPEAVAQLRRAVALRPDYAEAQGNLGVVLADAGQTDDAIVALGAAVSLQPDALRLHYHLANALFRRDRLAEAITHYERALQIDAGYAEIHARLARALASAGRPADANARYARARELDPTLPVVRF